MIGAGFARTTQIPGFQACERARVVAIASRSRENAQSVAREFAIPVVADDWRALLTRDDVDLVSIVTPPVTHMEMALAALDAGKAVICEKPMAMDAAEADAMQKRAHETGALALIDHELRFLASRRRMRELIRTGEIGHIIHAKLSFRADSRAAPERAWNWWSDTKAGGGVLGALGSHAVDALRWLLGTEVSRVSATLATHITERPAAPTGERRPVTTDDEANLLLDFADGELTQNATGTISLSVVEAGSPAHRLEIFGSRGALMEEAGALWRAPVGAGEWQPVEVERDPLAARMQDNEWSRGFTVFARAIVESLRRGSGAGEVAGAATFSDGYRTQLVLDAARRAHETGCRVAL